MQSERNPARSAPQLHSRSGTNPKSRDDLLTPYELEGRQSYKTKGKPFQLTVFHARIVAVPILLFIIVTQLCSQSHSAPAQPENCSNRLKECKVSLLVKVIATVYLAVEVCLLVDGSKKPMVTEQRLQRYEAGMASRFHQSIQSFEVGILPNVETQKCPAQPAEPTTLPSPPTTPIRTRPPPLPAPIDCSPTGVKGQQKPVPRGPLVSPESPARAARLVHNSQGQTSTSKQSRPRVSEETQITPESSGEESSLGLQFNASGYPLEVADQVNSEVPQIALGLPFNGPGEVDDGSPSQLQCNDLPEPNTLTGGSWHQSCNSSSFQTSPTGIKGDSIAFIQVNRSMRGRVQKPEGRPQYCGGYSDVWKCSVWFYEATDDHPQKVAVKVLRPFGLNGCSDAEALERMIERLNREVIAWSAIHHPNIVPLLGLTITPILALISPWYDQGNVRTYLNRNTRADRLQILHDVASGLDHLHSQTPEIIHGDIKPENVLIGARGEALIIDFGLATVMEHDLLYGTSHRQGGSVRWMAPELLMNVTKSRSRSSDVYSFGGLACEIMTGVPPHATLEDPQIYFAVCNPNDPKSPIEDTSKYPQLEGAVGKMISQCWCRLPERRPSMAELRRELDGLLGQPSV